MARVCEACGKKPLVGNTVSHANNRAKKRSLPNLQNKRVKVAGVTKTMRLCSRCIRNNTFTAA